MLPIFFGILTSLCFAIASLLAQRGYHSGPAPWGAWITIFFNALFLSAFHLIIEGKSRVWIADNWIYCAVGLFVPGVTRVLSFRGIRNLGSSITSTIVNTTPMFSTLAAMLILGERPSWLVLAGVMLTVGGLIVVSWGRQQTAYRKVELIFPFLCALLFCGKDIAVRWGLADGGGQPILAAAIAATVSTVEIFLIVRYVHQQPFTLPCAHVAGWFVASGIFTGGSFLFMYVAYSMERVSVVAPLVNSYTIFVSLLTPVMAQQIESVTKKKLAGAALVVTGIFAVSFGRD